MAAQPPALAGDCTASPCLGYALSLELEDDWIFESDPDFLRSNDLEPTLDTRLYLVAAEHLKLEALITTEQVIDRAAGESQAFEGIGSYVAELHASFTSEAFSLRLGKFDPVFGLATNELDGIQATDLVGDYDLEERWAAQASINLEAAGLFHSLTASLFTNDRTILSESVFSNRGQSSLEDGGAGNTDDISSAAIVLDGCKGAQTSDCYSEGDFGYRLGFRYQQAGRATAEQIEDEIRPHAEFGYLAAGTARFQIEEATIRSLGEVAYFRGYQGEPDDAVIVTGAVEIENGPMRYMAAYSQQRNLLAGESDTTERLADVTVKYSPGEDAGFAEAWSLGAGYSYGRDDEDETVHVLSVLLTVDFEGNTQSNKDEDDED